MKSITKPLIKSKASLMLPLPVLILSLWSVQTQAQTPTQMPSVSIDENAVASVQYNFSDAELSQILAPIALYPDSLLTHILIASTYPIEIISAQRWLESYESENNLDFDLVPLSNEQIESLTPDLDWDPSVKALLRFPSVLDKLSEELDWTQKLGNAFLENEENVLANIQTLRKKADEAGNLDQMDKMEVVREEKTIIIESAEPEVIYVPYYDTRVVYGDWRWSHRPPIYWHAPRHYAYQYGHFYWHTGVHVSLNLLFGAFHWHNHHVILDHDRHFRRHRYNRHHYNRHGYARETISHAYKPKRWRHKPHHRRGVAYHSNRTQHKFHSNRLSVQDERFNRRHQRVEHKRAIRKGHREEHTPNIKTVRNNHQKVPHKRVTKYENTHKQLVSNATVVHNNRRITNQQRLDKVDKYNSRVSRHNTSNANNKKRDVRRVDKSRPLPQRQNQTVKQQSRPQKQTKEYKRTNREANKKQYRSNRSEKSSRSSKPQNHKRTERKEYRN